MWQYSKFLAPVGILIGCVAVALTFTSFDELSAPSHFALYLGLVYCAYVVWDMLLLKDVSTVEQIVKEKNLAYAVFSIIPALLAIAAACAL